MSRTQASSFPSRRSSAKRQRLVVQCAILDWTQEAIRKKQAPVEAALAQGMLTRRHLAQPLKLSPTGVLATSRGDVEVRLIDVKEAIFVPACNRISEVDLLLRLSTGRQTGATTIIERADPWSANRHEVTVYAGTFDVNQQALGKSEQLLRDIGLVCQRWFWSAVPAHQAGQRPARPRLGPSALRTGGKPLPGFDF